MGIPNFSEKSRKFKIIPLPNGLTNKIRFPLIKHCFRLRGYPLYYHPFFVVPRIVLTRHISIWSRPILLWIRGCFELRCKLSILGWILDSFWVENEEDGYFWNTLYYRWHVYILTNWYELEYIIKLIKKLFTKCNQKLSNIEKN